MKEKVLSIINETSSDVNFSMKDLTDSEKLKGLLGSIEDSLSDENKVLFNSLISNACQEICKGNEDAAWILKAFPRNLILIDSYSGDTEAKGVVPGQYLSQQPLARVLEKRINGYKAAMIKTQIIKGDLKKETIAPLCSHVGLDSQLALVNLLRFHELALPLPRFDFKDAHHILQRELWITATTAWSLVNGRYNPPEILADRMKELNALLAK